MDILLKIARAEPGYRGRYVGERLRSIQRLLDDFRGKPTERRGADGTAGEVQSALLRMVGDMRSEHGENPPESDDGSPAA